MSWTRVNDSLTRSLFKQIEQLFKTLDRKIRKNLTKVFVVHPSSYTRYVIRFIRQFTSGKLSNKIIEIYNWESMQSDINKEDITLPETSKDYITKSHQVIKVNSKGKNQKRLIKFTMDSILNIDPRTKKIQNERKIFHFSEIVSFIDSPEIQIHFNDEYYPIGAKFSKSSADKLLRRYIFDSFTERDKLLLNIFHVAFYAKSIQFPQEFKVVKVNKRGRHQDRILKISRDSLLNLDGQSIKVSLNYFTFFINNLI